MAGNRCRCGKEAVYFRKCEGRHLCAGCFCSSLEKKVKRTIREWKMISPGDTIGVGVSGGKDSLTVLSLVSQVVRPMKTVKLLAISIDEGIEGYRTGTIRKAEAFCKKHHITHKVYTFKDELGSTLDEKLREVGEEQGCSYCGVARRYMLNKAARELGVTKLCTGHNMDDEVQSGLMNMLRGDLLRASRMDRPEPADEKFVVRIKPLRDIPEREVALYAILKGFDVDFSECTHLNGIRFEVRDFLNEMEQRHPGMKFSLNETISRLSPHIKESLKDAGQLKECTVCGEPASGDVCKLCEMWRSGREKLK